jgi:Holliday junction resolvase RusA-like endonuclease
MTKTGHAYTPEATRCYEQLVAVCARRACCQPVSGPVHVEILVGKEVPVSKPKRTKQAMLSGEIRPMTKPDLDNVIKAVLDGCNKIAYLDDKQIVSLETQAFYVDEPRVRVRIIELCGGVK